MAGHSVRPASIGVGPALRRAREIAGITLDEAARDTRLTPDQIGALEREDFDLLGEEVYVRAMLRTYAQYLGLKPDKVMSAYAKHAEEPELPSPPAKRGRVEQALAAARIRDNQRFLLIVAAIILIAAVAVGIVSRGGAPPPATIPTATTPFVSPTPGPGVGVTVSATAGVDVTATIDGVAQPTTSLGPGESISYSAVQELTVSASDGGAVRIVVDDRTLGVPGQAGHPWSATFLPSGATAEPSP